MGYLVQDVVHNPSKASSSKPIRIPSWRVDAALVGQFA